MLSSREHQPRMWFTFFPVKISNEIFLMSTFSKVEGIHELPYNKSWSSPTKMIKFCLMAKIFHTLLFLHLSELKLSVWFSCALVTLDALSSPTWQGATCLDSAAQRGVAGVPTLHPYELKCGRNTGRHPGCHLGAGEHLGPHVQNQNPYFNKAPRWFVRTPSFRSTSQATGSQTWLHAGIWRVEKIPRPGCSPRDSDLTGVGQGLGIQI